jgi:hypothetical protein
VSPRRIDYYDTPEAPKANSLVPSVNVVVVTDAGETLMIRRTDNGNHPSQQRISRVAELHSALLINVSALAPTRCRARA